MRITYGGYDLLFTSGTFWYLARELTKWQKKDFVCLKLVLQQKRFYRQILRYLFQPAPS